MMMREGCWKTFEDEILNRADEAIYRREEREMKADPPPDR
jgi:hypothetical protein